MYSQILFLFRNIKFLIKSYESLRKNVFEIIIPLKYLWFEEMHCLENKLWALPLQDKWPDAATHFPKKRHKGSWGLNHIFSFVLVQQTALEGKLRAALAPRKLLRTTADTSATTFLLVSISLTSLLQRISASKTLTTCLSSREIPLIMTFNTTKESFQGILLSWSYHHQK